ncbi:hypothetical protein LY90DRAFT_518672, partial [Neocallimastix californiae]
CRPSSSPTSTNQEPRRWSPHNSGKCPESHSETPKIIRKEDLDLLYIQGIQRQPIWIVKKCLSNLGIRHFYIRNVSFIGKDICELTVLKKFKPMITDILKVFENSFKVLENFNPSSTSGNNFAAPPSGCAPDNAPATPKGTPANSPGSNPKVANAARRSTLKERVISPSKGFAVFKAASPSGPLESPEFKGTSELFEDDDQCTEDDNDSIISSTLTPTVPIEHYQEAGMDMYSDTIISNSPNILNTTINPLNLWIIVRRILLNL